jgi:gas vesicle protein
VDERTQVVLTALLGAVVGALAGYLFLTESGRRLRSQLEPRLDAAAREVGRLRQTVAKAQTVASEGWRSINEIRGHGADWGGGQKQTSPF